MRVSVFLLFSSLGNCISRLFALFCHYNLLLAPFISLLGLGLDLRHRPDIEFAPDADDMVFTATTPKLASAKTLTNHHISSVSSSRLRR